ncbi:MAG: hypothetical protein HYS87_00530 [Candidatus Colwellbacteria bacterium]|nr:hypothetical protein [Candidatus Colwellbacteria bacterium]
MLKNWLKFKKLKKISRERLVKWYIILIVGILLSGALFYLQANLRQVGIDFTAEVLSEEIEIGKPFEVKLEVFNNTNSDMTDVNLHVEVQDGISILGRSGRAIEVFEIGDIRSQGTHTEVIEFVAMPTERDTRDIPISINYGIGSLKTVFEKRRTINVDVGEADLSLEVVAPETVVAGVPFEVSVLYENLGNEDFESVKLKMDFPNRFSLVSSLPKPSTDNIWELSLTRGESGKIVINGKVDLRQGEEFAIKASILDEFLEEDYALVESTASVLMDMPVLALDIELSNKGGEYHPGDTMEYELVFKNNSKEAMEDITVSAKFSGEMYNFETLDTEGAVWNPRTKVLEWNSELRPDLEVLNPGASGVLDFNIQLLDSYPIRKLNDKNFAVSVEASAKSKSTASAFLETKIAGETQINAFGLYRDAESFIVNSGPWPPEVDKATEFTVHWEITNYSTDLSNVEVRALLPFRAEFTGVVKGNSSYLPEHDGSTNEVVWRLDKVFATAGIVSDAPSAVFQIRINPPGDNLGTYAQILFEAKLTATDDWTGSEIEVVAPGITTLLPNDRTVSEGEGKVRQ